MSQAQPTLLQGNGQQLVRNVLGTNFKTQRGRQERAARLTEEPLPGDRNAVGLPRKVGPSGVRRVFCGSVLGSVALGLLPPHTTTLPRSEEELRQPQVGSVGGESLFLPGFAPFTLPDSLPAP